ncbi:hypothetical protein K491DRAFT_718864 [Lophiostoma macrostomum CBS 122681]|uniref:MCM3-like winged helix domain-containing protein n=1 Tax=Lophiostoma macrostomum CBS 122681 TaxID=1314788 RepID=A0A6A6SXP3_9PLEO|nr:hypothetical protein K491DRAFT_718864 [Lophiostoma macrostomum CBS 122681]
MSSLHGKAKSHLVPAGNLEPSPLGVPRIPSEFTRGQEQSQAFPRATGMQFGVGVKRNHDALEEAGDAETDSSEDIPLRHLVQPQLTNQPHAKASPPAQHTQERAKKSAKTTRAPHTVSKAKSRPKSKGSSQKKFNARRPSPVSPTTSRIRLTEERFDLFYRTLENLTAEKLFNNRDEALPVLRVIKSVNMILSMTAPAFDETEALAALWRLHDMELVLMARNGVVHRLRLARGSWGTAARSRAGAGAGADAEELERVPVVEPLELNPRLKKEKM